MDKYSGQYLFPNCFITKDSDSFITTDFDEFLKNNSMKFGEVAVEFIHKTANNSNVVIKITFDGIIAMETPTKLPKDVDARIVITNHINSFLSKLSMGGVHFSPIQYNQIVHLEFENEKLLPNNTSFLLKKINLLNKKLRNYNINDFESNLEKHNDYMSELKKTYNNPIAFSIQALKEAEKNGDYIVKEFFNKSESLFLETYESYKQGKYEISLVLGWTLIEIIITKYWITNFENIVSKIKETLYVNVEKFIDCKDYLKIKKRCNIAPKIEYLYKAGVFNKSIFDKLQKLKEARNQFIHKSKIPNVENARYILMALKEIVKIFKNIDMKFNNPGW